MRWWARPAAASHQLRGQDPRRHPRLEARSAGRRRSSQCSSRNGPTELEAGTEAEAWKGRRRRGHEVKLIEQNSGIHAIVVTPAGLVGGADSRRKALPSAIDISLAALSESGAVSRSKKFGSPCVSSSSARKVRSHGLWRSARRSGRRPFWSAAPSSISPIHRDRGRIDRNRGDVIVNAAAYTAVDQAEADPELAEAINGIGAASWPALRPR